MAGSVAGQVINQRDGQPIAGANLQLMPEGGEQRSDNNGNFNFSGLAAGNDYELVVSQDGFENGIYGPLVVMDGATTQMALALQPTDF